MLEPFHLLQQLLQAALKLGADCVGLITTSRAAAPHVGPLLRGCLRMLQEKAGYHLSTYTQTHTVAGNEANKCEMFSVFCLYWLDRIKQEMGSVVSLKWQ